MFTRKSTKGAVLVDSLSGDHPQFRYDLILIAMSLKFLQGSGAMGGFLNTIRVLLWLGVQQVYFNIFLC